MTTSFTEAGVPTVAFHVVNNDKTHFVEWETQYGAITKMKVVSKDYIPTAEELLTYGPKGVINNYFFEYTLGRAMWAQLAVDELDLKGKLHRGEMEKLYNDLKAYLP
jgi:hypothetical protein